MAIHLQTCLLYTSIEILQNISDDSTFINIALELIKADRLDLLKMLNDVYVKKSSNYVWANKDGALLPKFNELFRKALRCNDDRFYTDITNPIFFTPYNKIIGIYYNNFTRGAHSSTFLAFYKTALKSNNSEKYDDEKAKLFFDNVFTLAKTNSKLADIIQDVYKRQRWKSALK